VRRCGIVDEEVDEAACDTPQLFEEMLQLSFVTNLMSFDRVGIAVVPCVLAMFVKPLWNYRHLSLRGGCRNDVVHSIGLIVSFVFWGMILELHENIREVCATFARSSTKCLIGESSSPSRLSGQFDQGKLIYHSC
jgi:hypothetical protein